MDDPRAVYSKLLEQRRAEIAHDDRRHRSLGYWRLAAAAAGAVLVWLALVNQAISILWLLAPVVLFVILAVRHEHLLRLLERQRRAQRFFESGLARLDGNWPGTGEQGEQYLDAAHPYAQDLDIFGKGSIFELLCTARTHVGQDTLARWLLAPAEPETARERQQAVEELQPRLDLREDLAVLAEEARSGIDPASLAAWGEAPAELRERWLRPALWLFLVLGVSGLAAFLTAEAISLRLVDLPAPPFLLRDYFLLVLIVNGIFFSRIRKPVQAVVGKFEEAAHQLRLLSEVLVRLEREHFRSPLLARLRASLDAEGAPPSRRIARLNRLLDYLDSRDNLVLRVAEVFIFWTPHWAVRVEDWRRESGRAVRRWLTAAGEMEALCSLASHRFEHPADVFPEFVPDHGRIEAEGIAHPLIAEARVVRNDITIGGAAPHVFVVSGSNMSGKSTLLRTIGTNAVLAQAGAAVRARRLRISPLAIGASIRVTDSLQGGVSRFYAEILRIRQILDATSSPLPVLFLIDEFLHGTNSHDRRIGAQALVRTLVERGAIGLITTHDLALADIVGALGERAANTHFEDQLEDGKIHFDYVMRPGVVRKSNAIELMRSVGLEI